MVKTKKDKTQPHTIRFPQDVYEEAQRMAEAQRRTFNAQVIFLIEQGMRVTENLQECKEKDT